MRRVRRAGGVDRAPRARHGPPRHPGRGRAAGRGRDRARVRRQHGHRRVRLLDRPAARRERRRRRPAVRPRDRRDDRLRAPRHPRGPGPRRSRGASACSRSSTAAARARTSCATSTSRRCSRARRRSRSGPAAWNATPRGSCARRWPASDPARTRMARRTRSCELAVSELARQLDDEAGGRLWTLADAVARARQASPDQVGLVDRDPRGARAAVGPLHAAFVPAVSLDLPAWSEPFAEANRDRLRRGGPWGRVDRGWAFGDGSGRGVRVAIVDSGVERDHPAVGRTARRERRGRAGRRRLAGRAHTAERRRGPRDGVRGDHPRPRARGGDRLDPRPRAGQPGQRRRLRRGPLVGDHRGRRERREPLAVVTQRRLLRAAPRARRRGVLPERAARVRRQQRVRGELSVAVRRGRLRRGARPARSRRVVLQPRAAGRVRRATASTSTSRGAAARGWS